MYVFSHPVKTARGILFHHVGARTEKNLNACLSCILRDGGSNLTMCFKVGTVGSVGELGKDENKPCSCILD